MQTIWKMIEDTWFQFGKSCGRKTELSDIVWKQIGLDIESIFFAVLFALFIVYAFKFSRKKQDE